ncbi:hypothetical protein JXA63_01910 [Candidatus Woesebacteria bacterium]|nr:hypothetical protein [Candidatus Woesebacteria bacterium]
MSPQNVAVAILIFFAAVFLVLSFVQSGVSEQETITKDQIRMNKNGEIITVNRNGLVEYRTEDKITYKIWDSGKVARFFDMVENKARDYLENPNQTSNCVWVSLYLDGELVTICFSEDDEVIQEAYEEFDNGDDSISLSDLFDDGSDDEDEEDEVDDLSDYFAITPTPTFVPTSTPGGTGDTGQPQLPPPLPIEATCESWEEQIVGGRAIISNTLCSVSVQEE